MVIMYYDILHYAYVYEKEREIKNANKVKREKYVSGKKIIVKSNARFCTSFQHRSIKECEK